MQTKLIVRSRARVSRLGLSVVITSVAMWVAACATTSPPTELMAVSSAAVARAVSAGGNESAPIEMQLARDKLDRARAAMDSKDYEVARKLAQQAQVDAQLAEAKTQAGRANKAASVVKDDSRVLREELERKSK